MEDVIENEKIHYEKLEKGESLPEKAQTIDEEEDSPFEMVRVAVSNKDDPTLPTLTFRVWAIGLFFTVVLAFINQFFWFRETPITLTVIVVQLLSYPFGVLLAKILPTGNFTLFGKEFTLNPGPFNIKEHVLITAFANAGAGTVYAIDIVVIKEVFYKTSIGFFDSLLLVWTTQMIGYGMAGLVRRFLIRPAAMIWPLNLINVTLFRTLHENQKPPPGMMTRVKFFWLFFCISLLYYFIPGYLFTFLSYIPLLCLIAPENIVAQQLGDPQYGLGIMGFSLDWAIIASSFTLSPLSYPFWAQCNIFFGFVLIIWIVLPIGYYSNVWNSQIYPIMGPGLYTVTGEKYNITRITPNHEYSEAEYQAYSPLRITFFFAMSYGFGFANLASVLSYIALHHGKEIVQRFREARSYEDDIHAKLMDRYPEVPNWWYGVMFLTNVVLGIILCEVFDIQLPWWGFFLAIGIALTFLLPVGIVQAVTNQQPGLNIITEFIIGLIMPGYPIANVTFKTYGYIAMAQALLLVQDLKLGHYMKIPPRDMFITQSVGTLLAATIQLATAWVLIRTVDGICGEHPPWTCRSAKTFFSASVIWGLIGPMKMFGPGSPYQVLNLFFIGGLLIPIPIFLLQRRYPNSWLRYVHVPIILGATGVMPPAPAIDFPMWFLVGFIFNYIIHKYRNEWWKQFNYVLSAALDSGLAISGVLIYFIFQFNGIEVNWWGNKETHCPLGTEPLKSPPSTN